MCLCQSFQEPLTSFCPIIDPGSQNLLAATLPSTQLGLGEPQIKVLNDNRRVRPDLPRLRARVDNLNVKVPQQLYIDLAQLHPRQVLARTLPAALAEDDVQVARHDRIGLGRALDPSLGPEEVHVVAVDALVQQDGPVVGVNVSSGRDCPPADCVALGGDPLGKSSECRGHDAEAFVEDGLQIRQLLGLGVFDGARDLRRLDAFCNLRLELVVDVGGRREEQHDVADGRSSSVRPGDGGQSSLGFAVPWRKAVVEEIGLQ